MPLVKLSTVQLNAPVVLHVLLASCTAVTLKLPIGEPPVLVGRTHCTVAALSPGVAETPVGASGCTAVICRVCDLSAAADQFASPACVAEIVQLPAATTVTKAPDTVQTAGVVLP